MASEAAFRLTFKSDTPGGSLAIRWSAVAADMLGDPNLTVQAMSLSLTRVEGDEHGGYVLPRAIV